jgi:hypothetical protein
MCRTSGVVKVFVNGTQVASAANTTDVTATNLVIGGYYSTSYTLVGYIDDLRISSGIARYPYNFTPPTAEFPNIGGTVTLTADPYYEYTTLLLPGNGTNGAQNNTFLDSSTNNFTITRNGNTTQGTFSPFSQTGWGNYFDGATATRLTMPSNTAFAFGTGAYTVEAWVYLNAHAANQSTVFEAGTAGGALSVSVLSTGALSLGTYGVGALINSSASVVSLNQWNHVAVVRSSTASNDTKLYVNGTLVATGTDSSNWTVTTTPATGGLGLSGYTLNGYVSNLRVVKGTAVYTANFTPSTTPLTAITNTSLLTCQSNRFVDNSSNAFAITRNGNTSIQAFSPFNPTAAWSAATYGGSGYFDGSGDYLSFAGATANAMGSGDFTIEGWFYLTGTTGQGGSGEQGIIGVNTVLGSRLTIRLQGTSPKLMSWWLNGSGNNVAGTTAVQQNTWYHFALVRSGSASNNVKLYLNGVLESQGTSTYDVPADNYVIGRTYTDLNDEYWNGYLSGIRAVKGTAVYTGNFTPPTAPPTAISNTSYLLNYTNAGIYDATSKNDLETVGNAQISTTQSKFGGSSMAFDGSGDGLIGLSTQLASFGTGDFTVESWVYLTSISGADRYLFTTGNGVDNSLRLYLDSTGNVAVFTSNTLVLTSTNPLVVNTWTHVAVCRYNGTLAVYINGVRNGTASYSTAINCNGNISVGSANNLSASMIGYLDDMRVTKGIARYTSNFTPPTTAFLTL